MKPLILLSALLSALCLFISTVRATDPGPSHTYKGEVSGVMCAVCSGNVKAALSKLPGVQSVKILHGEKVGAPAKLVIVATSGTLTKEAANQALGGDQRSYNVLDLKLVDP